MGRHQEGYIFQRCGKWYVRYRENGRQVSAFLAESSDRFRAESDVRILADERLADINNGRVHVDCTLPVREYIEKQFLPAMTMALKPSTVRGFQVVYNTYLKPDLGNLTLREFRCVDACRVLSAIHRRKNVGRSQLRHCKTMLGLVFRHAKQQGIVDGENPVRDAAIPRAARKPEPTKAAKLEYVLKVLDVLDKAGEQKARLAVALVFFAGLRPGEARGCQWADFDGKHVTIRRSVWGTHVTEPRTERSVRTIPVREPLRSMLEANRIASGYILAGPRGKALNLNNLVRRVLVPALAQAEMKWQTWYALRRGVATLAASLERDLSGAQQLLGHSDQTVTARHYTKPAMEAAERAVERISQLCAPSVQQPS